MAKSRVRHGKVDYPYRSSFRVNRTLTGYDSLSLDEKQRRFDVANNIPVREGVYRGSLSGSEQPPLKEHKIISNSPYSTSQIDFDEREAVDGDRRR